VGEPCRVVGFNIIYASYRIAGGKLSRIVFVILSTHKSIIGTITIYKQIQFGKNRAVGFNRDGLLTVYMITPDLYQHYDVIRNDLLQSGVVTNVATSSGPATEIWENNSGFDWKGKDPDLESNFVTVKVTPGYGRTVGWQFKAGRDLSTEIASDTSAIVVNEAAVKYMGLTHPIDEIVQWDDDKFHIIGVIQDIVMGSPFEPIQPTIFLADPKNIYTISIRISPSVSSADAIRQISKVFQTYNPSVPFEYKFTADEYAKKFKTEEETGKLISLFAALAIFISCLGLLGLASFVAEQRTKEIGIRKVLGASVISLWRMLSKDFIVLTIISWLIAMPIAYFFLNDWLQKYEYRMELSWWIFAGTGVASIIITLLTVSFQAVKAAMMNPVKSLRSE
jgi:putative ABC transport system permease protein